MLKVETRLENEKDRLILLIVLIFSSPKWYSSLETNFEGIPTPKSSRDNFSPSFEQNNFISIDRLIQNSFYLKENDIFAESKYFEKAKTAPKPEHFKEKIIEEFFKCLSPF